MIDQVKAWNEVAAELGIHIVAPCDIQLPDGARIRATAHIRNFGAKNGMIADPNFAVLKPYTDVLVASGYGYSAISLGLDRGAIIKVLADWGWSASTPAPAWLPEIDDQSN
jgi:hypothetical protein